MTRTNQYEGWRDFTAGRPPLRKPRARPRDLEYVECVMFAEFLERKGLIYTHNPMGGLRPATRRVDKKSGKLVRFSNVGIKLQRMGTQPGVSDYFIANTPPNFPQKKGVWLEMKSEEGDEPTDDQWDWIIKMDMLGYLSGWAKGFDNAKYFIEEVAGF